MTTLNEKLLQAINEELPAATAGELRKFIEKAQAESALLTALQVTNAEQDKELKRLRGIENREIAIAKREAEATIREASFALKDGIAAVREDFNNKRVDEIRNLVSTVFQSNRLNYSMNIGMPYVSPGNNYPSTHNVSGNILKET